MHRKSAYFLFLAVLGMLVIGIVMLFSTSAFARDSHGDVYFFVKRQAVWLGVGLVVCAVAALVDYHFWQRTWWIWFGLALIALALCFVPHIGMRINGSRRWVGFGPVTFQPSEIAKIAVVFFLAWWFARHEKGSGRILAGLCHPVRRRRDPLAADRAGSRPRNDRADRRHDVRDHVRGRNQPGAARFALVRRPGRNSFRRHPHVGTNGPAFRVHGSGTL